MAPYFLAATSFVLSFQKESTAEAYRRDLGLYFRWCADVGITDPLQVKRVHLQGYVRHLASERRTVTGKPLASATVNRYVNTVKGYYTHALDEGYTELAPAHRLKLPKIINDPTKRRYLTRFEAGSLFRVARLSPNPSELAMLHLLCTMGMRVTAACEAQIEDMTRTPEGYVYLRTQGKGDKVLSLALTIPAINAISRAIGDRTSGTILLRSDGQPMKRRNAAGIVDRLCRAAGIRKHVTPHCFRRTHITLALKAGVPLDVVQRGVGHANPRTTQGYNALDVEPHAQASNVISAMIASAS